MSTAVSAIDCIRCYLIAAGGLPYIDACNKARLNKRDGVKPETDLCWHLFCIVLR
ncbi:hypothetical protein COEREDRAFT_92500 [Coemansia reversa NRRL 1564]|uniref:Uncharacterized protein n=1 Tax=Coemansia reversa (strain ATCC 12441 / NRRL 1564) TaxID=763665 RepID=A0A2G5BBU6_COERN|nr:hypothetical protein COEREDRAFT_92500 [Coemansia reversa NRRL 1564]|eukprot:PIA16488.1 hypothetical protein COEREDRAFT_92500 [Coemansia reversa NRRL 1564]